MLYLYLSFFLFKKLVGPLSSKAERLDEIVFLILKGLLVLTVLLFRSSSFTSESSCFTSVLSVTCRFLGTNSKPSLFLFCENSLHKL